MKQANQTFNYHSVLSNLCCLTICLFFKYVTYDTNVVQIRQRKRFQVFLRNYDTAIFKPQAKISYIKIVQSLPPPPVQLLKSRRGLLAVSKLPNYPVQSNLHLQNSLYGGNSSFLHWGIKLVHVL